MTNETEASSGAEQTAPPGCLVIAAVFVVACIAGALATLAVYGLVVEQLELIRVRREFGYEMILYAPLAGLVFGIAATLWVARGGPSSRRASMALYLGAFIALALLLVAFGSGVVM